MTTTVLKKLPVAEDVMTKDVITIREDQDIWSVSWTFVRRHITGAPVVDAAGKLVGVISQTDLAVFIWGQASQGEEFYVGLKKDEAGTRAPVLARELMTRKVVQAGPRTRLDRLAHTMREFGIHRIPITERGRLLGIVTSMDLLKALET